MRPSQSLAACLSPVDARKGSARSSHLLEPHCGQSTRRRVETRIFDTAPGRPDASGPHVSQRRHERSRSHLPIFSKRFRNSLTNTRQHKGSSLCKATVSFARCSRSATRRDLEDLCVQTPPPTLAGGASSLQWHAGWPSAPMSERPRR